MTTQTLSLSEFLLARITEDEAVAKAAISATGKSPWAAQAYRVVVDGVFEVADASVPAAAHMARHDPSRALAECKAKRAIVRDATNRNADLLAEDELTLLRLAAVYADHPDYEPAWA